MKIVLYIATIVGLFGLFIKILLWLIDLQKPFVGGFLLFITVSIIALCITIFILLIEKEFK